MPRATYVESPLPVVAGTSVETGIRQLNLLLYGCNGYPSVLYLMPSVLMLKADR